MSTFDRQERIRQLKVKAKRKEIITKLINLIPITAESFLSIEETVDITKKVYEKIDTVADQRKLEKQYQVNLDSLSALTERTKQLFDREVVVLHRQDRESGALILTLRNFWENYSDMLIFSGFQDGYRDLVIVDKELQFGICIERHEYHNNFVVWNT